MDESRTTTVDALEQAAGVLSPAALQEVLEDPTVLDTMHLGLYAILMRDVHRWAMHPDTPLPQKIAAAQLFQKSVQRVQDDVPQSPHGNRPLITIVLPGHNRTVSLSQGAQTIEAEPAKVLVDE